MKEASLSNNQVLIDTLKLISSRRKRFTGLVTPFKRLKETPLEAVDFPVRAYHCLKRAGCATVGDVLEKYPTKDAVRKIRNCGEKSANEIFIYMMLYQYDILSEKDRVDYLRRLLIANGLDA